MGNNLTVSYKVKYIHTWDSANVFLGTVSLAMMLVLKCKFESMLLIY